MSLKNPQVHGEKSGKDIVPEKGLDNGRRKIRHKYSSRDSWQPEVEFYLVSVFS
jgi:hypothetical protein